jgi:O-antigen ligase
LKGITQLKNIALYLVLFSLPMYMRLNNIALGFFFAFFILEGQYKNKWINLKKYYSYAIPLFALFLLAFIAAVNHPNQSIFKYLEKYWSYLIIPIAIISSSDYDGEKGKKLYVALLLGCVATLLICYGNVIYEMVVGKEPLHYFLRHRHLNHEFTAIADTHPAYLGVFIVCSTIYLLIESRIKKGLKILCLVFFAFGLIQLASRIALFSFGMILIFFLAFKLKKHWKQIATGVVIAAICGSLLYVFSSEFLRDRLVNTENFEKDQRFSRNIVSWEIFKEYPVLGIGSGRINSERIAKYDAYGFTVASEKNYNAHNQYLEYLSLNGLLGGFIFLATIFYLLYISWKHRSALFFLVFLVFFISNLTESMLVRIKGIEFLAITVSLLAVTTAKLKENEHINNP